MGLALDNGYTTFDMNPLTQDPADSYTADHTDTGQHSPCSPSPGDLRSLDMDFYPNDFTLDSLTPQFELTDMNFNVPIIPPSHLLADDEEDDDYGLLSPLGDLLENATILDEMSLLDLALDEGFSPEMTAQLEEGGYFDPEPANRNVGQFVTNVPNTEEDNDGTSRKAPRCQQGTPRNLCQGI